MPTRTNWGIIAVAVAFALVAIGVALTTSYFSKSSTDTGAPVATQSVKSADQEDWMSVLSQIATTSVDKNGNYVAPRELGKTEAITQEFVVAYLQLKNNDTLTTDEKNKKFQEIITREVQPVASTQAYTLTSLKTSQSVDLGTYADALTEALAKSTAVKEYELTTFARTVGSKRTTGTPALAEDATIYRGIERDLLAMQVPQQLAQEHLAVLQTVANLAQLNELMAKWSGDPIVGMSYLDAFFKADSKAMLVVNTLYTRLVALAQKQS